MQLKYLNLTFGNYAIWRNLIKMRKVNIDLYYFLVAPSSHFKSHVKFEFSDFFAAF